MSLTGRLLHFNKRTVDKRKKILKRGSDKMAETDLGACRHLCSMFDCVFNIVSFVLVFSFDFQNIIIFFFIQYFNEHVKLSDGEGFPLK